MTAVFAEPEAFGSLWMIWAACLPRMDSVGSRSPATETACQPKPAAQDW